MIDDSALQAANAKAAYEGRPWLKHYPGYIQPELTAQFASGLEMFLETARAMPEQAAIYYFDQTMSYGELDRKSSALVAALKEQGVTQRYSRMANYKYPRQIEILEDLPKTPTGKFLRRELRDKARQ